MFFMNAHVHGMFNENNTVTKTIAPDGEVYEQKTGLVGFFAKYFTSGQHMGIHCATRTVRDQNGTVESIMIEERLDNSDTIFQALKQAYELQQRQENQKK